MAGEAFDVEAATKAGYSTGEIADFLAAKKGFDIEAARKAGYTDADVLKHLAPPAADMRSRAAQVGDFVSNAVAKAAHAVVGDNPMQDIAVGSRSLAKGLMFPVNAAMDLPMQIRNYVGNEQNQMPSQAFDPAANLAEAVGTTAAAPQNPMQRMTAAVNEGGGAALGFGAGAAPASILRTGMAAPSWLQRVGAAPTATAAPGAAVSAVPTAVGSSIRSGVIGAGASEYLKEHNFPLWVQIAAGAIAPMGADAAGMVGKGMYATAMAPKLGGASPYTQGGRELAAGNVLARNTTSPGAVVPRLGEDSAIVPGTTQRTAEIADDFGMAQLDKLLQGTRKDTYGAKVANMEGANNRVMREAVDSAMPASTVAKAETAAKTITNTRNAMLAGADDIGKQRADRVVSLIDDLMDSKLAISDKNVRPALDEVRKQLFDSKGNLITDPDRLDGVRQYVSKMIAGQFDSPATGTNYKKANVALHQVLEKIKGGIDDSLAEAPGVEARSYSESLRATGANMKPGEQRGVLQTILDKASSKADILPGGEGVTGENYRLVLSKINSALDNERMASKAERVLTDDQLTTVGQVVKELERGAKLTSMQKNKLGSDTFANMSGAALFGRVLGIDLPPETLAKAPDIVQKTVGWIADLGGGPQKKIMALVEAAMQDPKLAAELLKKAPAMNPETFGQAMSRKGREYGAGAAIGNREKP